MLARAHPELAGGRRAVCYAVADVTNDALAGDSVDGPGRRFPRPGGAFRSGPGPGRRALGSPPGPPRGHASESPRTTLLARD